MVCSNCGTTNEPGRKFCKECGHRLAIVCPVCGTSNTPDAKFCGQCGTQFAATAAPQVASVLTTAGSGGVPPRASPVPTGVAEHRLVSVLFADLVGFTPFAEARDADDVREALTRYFDVATAAVTRYGGILEKFIGDAVMAVWGSPVAREDDAERAVRAALDLVSAVNALGAGIVARAAVMTGEAAVTLGAENQGMVVGDLVNTAARLQGAADPGTVLVGEATMRATSNAIAFEPTDDQTLKGKSAPVKAYRAIGPTRELGDRRRSDLVEPPFLGREEELQLLRQQVDATSRDRRARLVTISGPAGVGKTRLASELEKSLVESESVYWDRGRSPAYGDGIAFWALGEMVRRRAGLAENDDPETTRTKILASVAEFVEDPDDRRLVEPALLALLGLDPPPHGGREVLFAAWRLFFESVAKRGPTVLLFEDLHWADAGLLDFIDHLLDWSRDRPILVVGLTRPELFERRPDWGASHRNATTVTLEPLSEAVMRELIGTMVTELPSRATQQIIERANGIPLYAVELIRGLVADGRLERDGTVYRPVSDIHDMAVPESLHSLIAARLDSLTDGDRELLQDAAVLGQSFVPSTLAAVTGRTPDKLEPSLRGLVRRELLTFQEDEQSPEQGQYAFVQALTREVAYGTLSKRGRRSRHLAAARYFEGVGDDELSGVLAAHYVAAYEASTEGPEQDALAVQSRLALRAAADRATALGSLDRAVDYLERAIELTIDADELGDLQLRAATSSGGAAKYDLAKRFAERARSAFSSSANRQGAARATSVLAHASMNAGDLASAIAVLEPSVEEASKFEDAELEAELRATLSRALMRSSRYAEAVAAADRALDIAERLGREEIVAEALNNKGASVGAMGHLREAAGLLQAAIDIADQNGYVEVSLRAHNNHASTVAYTDPRRAAEEAFEGARIAERFGYRSNVLFLIGSGCFWAFDVGDDWDALMTRLDGALALDPEPFDRQRLLGAAALILVARGEATDEEMTTLGTLTEVLADPSARSLFQAIEADRLLLANRLNEASERFVRGAPQAEPDAWGFWLGAGRAAIWAGNLDGVRTALRGLEKDHSTGSWADAGRLAFQAGIAALEGRVAEAIAGYLGAIRMIEAVGADFDRARVIVDAAMALGPAPELTKEFEEARALFDRLRAKPWSAALERGLAADAASAEHHSVETEAAARA